MKKVCVTLVGPANAGKSTFINRWLNNKVSITSSTPHTTRREFTFSKTASPDVQIIITDTPGFVTQYNAWSEYMETAVFKSIKTADIIIFAIDVLRINARGVWSMFEFLSNAKYNFIIVFNKCDAIKKNLLYAKVQLFVDKQYHRPILFTSGATGSGIDLVEKEVVKHARHTNDFESIPLIDPSTYASEVIREKAFRILRNEVPFSLWVKITRCYFNKRKGFALSAIIYTNKNAHKKIIVGKNGHMIKKIGEAARLELMTRWGHGSLFLQVAVEALDTPQKAKEILMQKYDL